MRKLLKLGEMAHHCQCLHLSGHVTESIDDTTCVYCGYYTEQRRITDVDINRHNRLLRLFKKRGVTIEELQKNVWWNRIEELRDKLGLEEDEC